MYPHGDDTKWCNLQTVRLDIYKRDRVDGM